MSSLSKPYEKVIVALDYSNVEDAKKLVQTLGDRISWYKVGPVLFTRSGREIISFLHDKGKRIFLDLKLHDIPNVVGATVREIAEMGVDYVTVHCLGGRKMLEAASQACRGLPMKLLGVTLLTSHEPEELAQFGMKGTADELVLRLLTAAAESRLGGIVCSPHEIQKVRPRVMPGFLLVTPGIRLPDKEVYQDDQRRVATPREALAWGADAIVMGRPITAAREPREVVEHLFD